MQNMCNGVRGLGLGGRGQESYQPHVKLSSRQIGHVKFVLIWQVKVKLLSCTSFYGRLK